MMGNLTSSAPINGGKASSKASLSSRYETGDFYGGGITFEAKNKNWFLYAGVALAGFLVWKHYL